MYDLGFDAYLARQLEDYESRRYAADAAESQEDRIETRALEITETPLEFLCWLGCEDLELLDVTVTNRSGQEVTALAALVAHAPAWLREEAAQALATRSDFWDVKVTLGNNVTDLDVALLSTAPEWLRAEILDWVVGRLENGASK